MKDEKELVLYERKIKEYLSLLKGKKPGEMAGKSSKDKTKNALADFMLILSKHGRIWPEPSDYDEYCEHSTCKESETTQNVKRVERFFAWLEQQRRENVEVAEEYAQQDLFGKSGAGIEEPETLGAVEGETAQVIDEPSQLDDEPTTEPRAEKEPSPSVEEKPVPTRGGKRANAGRKRLDENGEIRNVKMTVYMTETTATDFQALCLLKHASSATDYVLGLIKGEIAKNEKALSFFREAEKLIE